VRDITTAALIQQMQEDGELGDIYADKSNFEQMIDMSRRIGYGYAQAGARPLDLEEWLRTSISTKQLAKPLAIEAPTPPQLSTQEVNELRACAPALQAVLRLAQNVRLELQDASGVRQHKVLITPTNEPVIDITEVVGERNAYYIPRRMIMGQTNAAFVLTYQNGQLTTEGFKHEFYALAHVGRQAVPEEHWVVRLDEAVEAFANSAE